MNYQPYNAFDSEWFKMHQEKLIWLLNSPITRRLFKWMLRIRKSDAGYHGVISRIMPNYYDVFRGFDVDGKVLITRDYRVHEKFAKRIYYSLQPVWWAMHFWDWAMADRFAPSLSFGFSTLTFYPEANPASFACDGVAYRFVAQEAFTTLTSSAGNGSTATATDDAGIKLQCGTSTDLYTFLVRSFLGFYVGDLLATRDTINSATVSVRGTSKTLGYLTSAQAGTNITPATPASNTTISNSDYLQVQNTRYCDSDLLGASYSTSGYNDYVLNATGIAAIGRTNKSVFKVSMRAAYDIDNTKPNWSSGGFDVLQFNHADNTGTSADPKLVLDMTANNYILPRNVGKPRPWSPGIAK